MKDPQLAAMSSAIGAGEPWLGGPRFAWVRWSIGAIALLLLAALAVEALMPLETAQRTPTLMKALAWTQCWVSCWWRGC
jgi:hypothetical protein